MGGVPRAIEHILYAYQVMIDYFTITSDAYIFHHTHLLTPQIFLTFSFFMHTPQFVAIFTNLNIHKLTYYDGSQENAMIVQEHIYIMKIKG